MITSLTRARPNKSTPQNNRSQNFKWKCQMKSGGQPRPEKV